MDESIPPEGDGEEYAYVIGQVLGENLEVQEADLDLYEHIADQEGQTLDEFVENLDEVSRLVISTVKVRKEILSWDVSKACLPDSDSIDAVHTTLTEATSQVSEYPYDEFFGWLPDILDYLEETLVEVLGVCESLDDINKMEDRVSNLPGADSILDDLQESKESHRQIGAGLIENMQELIRDIPLPKEIPETTNQNHS